MLIVGAILTFPAAVLISTDLGWIISKKRIICRDCNHKSLKPVQFIRATIQVDGKRTPDNWSYYICEHCGTPYKLHRKEWSIPSDTEWKLHCKEKA